MNTDAFSFPIWVDLAAVMVGALAGTTAAARKNYDFIGMWILGMITGMGGSLMRDAFFIQNGPPAVMRTDIFILVCFAATLVTMFIGKLPRVLAVAAEWTDTATLGLYAIFGASKALSAGLSPVPVVVVGLVNAVGGGLLRDFILHEDPAIFKPGVPYASPVIVGSAVFVLLVQNGLTHSHAGLTSAGLIIALRTLAIVFKVDSSPKPPKAPAVPPAA